MPAWMWKDFHKGDTSSYYSYLQRSLLLCGVWLEASVGGCMDGRLLPAVQVCTDRWQGPEFAVIVTADGKCAAGVWPLPGQMRTFSNSECINVAIIA
mgnify:FL=1